MRRRDFLRKIWVVFAILPGLGLLARWYKKVVPSSESVKGEGAVARSSGDESEGERPVAQVLSPQEHHWVGDGFFVSTIFFPLSGGPRDDKSISTSRSCSASTF